MSREPLSLDFPRVLLLTRYGADIRYAGGEQLRRIVQCLPSDRILWCGLGGDGPSLGSDGSRYLFAKTGRLHWRLESSTANYLYVNQLRARKAAADIWRQVRAFRPEVLWVLPELAAVNVAWHLARRNNLPLHATIHDAHEFSRNVCVPPLYYRLYMRDVKRLLRRAVSLDCISENLLLHVRRQYGISADVPAMVFPPSVSAQKVRLARVPNWVDATRRIGLCGSFRISAGQWQEFLNLLAALPYRFRITAYTEDAMLGEVRLPPNVSVLRRDYVASEDDMIEDFRASEIDACYLGVWREPEKVLFGSTSVSSKIVSYAASGTPVIVDAPADSVVARLVERYDAGVVLGADSRRCIEPLFSDVEGWRRKSEGARRLCLGELNLEKNVTRLALQMRLACRGRSS